MSLSTNIAGWLSRMKNSSVSFVIERALQRSIEDYGRMLNFYIDSRQKTIQFEVFLKGETESLSVIVQEYEIISEGAQTFIIAKKAVASREWVNTLIQQFVVGQRLQLPDKYASLVKMVA